MKIRDVVSIFVLAGSFMLGLSGTVLAATAVDLGTAGSFAVLGGSTVTNTGPTVINGDMGLSPGTSVTGFPPGVVNGTQHVTDAVATQAQADTATAYNAASGQTTGVTIVAGDLGGLTLTPGIYKSTSSLGLTGTVTLDGQGDPAAVFLFQVGSALTTASASRVALINGAQACNVFWQVGSSATLGTNSNFVGTILALSSVTVTTGASVDGRVLARNGAVTLDTSPVSRPTCAAPVVVPPPVVPAPVTPTSTPAALVPPVILPVVAPPVIALPAVVPPVFVSPAFVSPAVVLPALVPPVVATLVAVPNTGIGLADEMRWYLLLAVPSAIFALVISLYLFRKKA